MADQHDSAGLGGWLSGRGPGAILLTIRSFSALFFSIFVAFLAHPSLVLAHFSLRVVAMQPGAGWTWSAGAVATMAQPLTQPTNYQNFGYQSGNVHRVTVRGLTPGVRYRYRVGDRRPTSALAVNDALSGELGPYRQHEIGGAVAGQRIVIVGDLGQSSVSQDTLRQIVALKPDLVQLNGDLAYANGVDQRWDSWQRMIRKSSTHQRSAVGIQSHDVISRPLLTGQIACVIAFYCHMQNRSPRGYR